MIVPGMNEPMTMSVAMAVTMTMTRRSATQEPGAGDIDRETDEGDGNRLGKVDRHRREQPAHRLIADQERDHRQNDGAGEAGEIAELSGAEG